MIMYILVSIICSIAPSSSADTPHHYHHKARKIWQWWWCNMGVMLDIVGHLLAVSAEQGGTIGYIIDTKNVHYHGIIMYFLIVQ